MSAWDDIRFEWGRGSYRLSTEDSRVVMARLADLERIARDVAAKHPQNGYFCMWCSVEMNNHELPPGYYGHESSCTWLRAVSATAGAPGVSETHTDPPSGGFEDLGDSGVAEAGGCGDGPQ